MNGEAGKGVRPKPHSRQYDDNYDKIDWGKNYCETCECYCKELGYCHYHDFDLSVEDSKTYFCGDYRRDKNYE